MAPVPRGLKGEEIALGARIFSVADTLDAITSDRPYRAPRPLPWLATKWNASLEDSLILKWCAYFSTCRDHMGRPAQEINSQIYRFTYPIKPIQVFTTARVP